MSKQYEKLIEQQARLKQKLSGKILSYANLNTTKIGKPAKPVLAD